MLSLRNNHLFCQLFQSPNLESVTTSHTFSCKHESHPHTHHAKIDKQKKTKTETKKLPVSSSQRKKVKLHDEKKGGVQGVCSVFLETPPITPGEEKENRRRTCSSYIIVVLTFKLEVFNLQREIKGVLLHHRLVNMSFKFLLCHSPLMIEQCRHSS